MLRPRCCAWAWASCIIRKTLSSAPPTRPSQWIQSKLARRRARVAPALQQAGPQEQAAAAAAAAARTAGARIM
jgi:hypothetical protein